MVNAILLIAVSSQLFYCCSLKIKIELSIDCLPDNQIELSASDKALLGNIIARPFGMSRALLGIIQSKNQQSWLIPVPKDFFPLRDSKIKMD